MVQRVGVILIDQGRVLLIRRHNRGQEYFVLPGGHTEAGETAEAAAVREIKEECGVDVVLGDKLLDFENSAYTLESQRYIVFAAQSFSGEVTGSIGGPEGERADAAKAYSLEWHVPDDLTDLNIMPAELKKLLVKEAPRWT